MKIERRRRCFAAAALAIVATLGYAVPARAEFEFLSQFGAPRPGELVLPIDVERDSAANTFVVDSLLHNVREFDSTGTLVRTTGTLGTGPGEFVFPTAIGLNDANGEIYVADISGFSATAQVRIQRFDASGNFLGQFGTAGTGEGQIGFVRGISVDPAGNVYVVDANRIDEFDAGGSFVRMWGKDVKVGGGTGFEVCTTGCKQGEGGSAEGEFRFPKDVAASAFGVYVADEGNSRVQRFSATGAFQLMGGKGVGGGGGYETCMAACQAGISGSAAGEFATPSGIDVNSAVGSVLVADSGNSQIQVYSPGLAPTNQFGSAGSGDGQFDSAQGLAEVLGTVAVADPGLHRVQIFAGTTLQTKFGEPGEGSLVLPGGIGVGSGGVYVTDHRNRVARFDAAGTFLGAFGSKGSSVGQFLGPEGITAGPTGDIYVVDRLNNRIQRFNSDGGALGMWGSAGASTGQFTQARDVAVASDGSVYTVEQDTARVQKFSRIGSFRGTWGAEGSAAGQFEDPEGVATDAEGNVYVADAGNDRIQKFDSDGAFITAFGGHGSGDGELSEPLDVATDPLGNVYVADTANNRIERFDADGNFLGRWGAGGGDGSSGEGQGKFLRPAGVSVGPDGSIYVLDSGNNRVQRFAGAAAGAGDGGAATSPVLTLRGHGRQRLGRLRVRVGCKASACSVKLFGRVIAARRRGGHREVVDRRGRGARRVVTKLRRVRLTLEAGETAAVKLRLRKRGGGARRIRGLLGHRGRGLAVIRAIATGDGGSEKASIRVRLRSGHR